MLRVLQMSDLTREQPRMNRDQMLGTVCMSKETYCAVERDLFIVSKETYYMNRDQMLGTRGARVPYSEIY